MPLPATVAHLDIDAVADVLINHHANIRNAARALNVPSGDLRKWVLLDERLSAAALEAVELRLDDAEANLSEALHCGDPRRRDAVSMFMLRNTQRASKRGYAVAASAASLEVGLGDPGPRRIIVSWRNPGEFDDDKSDADNGGWKPPVYGDGRREGDIEGELAGPSVMLEHAAAGPERAEEPAVGEPAAAEPESAVIEAPEPSPPSPVTSANGSTPGFATGSSPIRSPPVCSVVTRSSRGRIGRRRRTARRERAFIGPVTPNGVLSGKLRRGRRWDSRAEPFRSEKSRHMRDANVARVARCRRCQRGPVPLAAAGSCVGTPSTMIAAENLVDREAGPEPSNKD